MSTDEWIKKMWYINTIEYYSAVKKNDIMKFVANGYQDPFIKILLAYAIVSGFGG